MSAFTKKELESFDENSAEKKLNPKVQGVKMPLITTCEIWKL